MTKTITLGEATKWVAGKLQDFALGFIPDEGKIEILTRRLDRETQEALRLFHEALAEEVKVQNPEHPGEGSLPKLRVKWATREARGLKAGQELKGGVSKRREKELKDIMDQAEADIAMLEQQVASEEKLLTMLQQTAADRRDIWQQKASDLKKLRQWGPAIVAQTKMLADAEKRKLEAAAVRASGKSADVDSVLGDLMRNLDDAQAGATAAELVVDDQEPTIDLDALDEEDARATQISDRRARWCN